MKKSIQILAAAFVVTLAASCNKPAENTASDVDTTTVEAPAPVEPAPADTTATTDTTAVAQ